MLYQIPRSYKAQAYEMFVYSTSSKMDVFRHWRHILSPAQRVEALEKALDYELWGQLVTLKSKMVK